ncbi:MAG TPA: glutathione S-transferase family protein [Candidatus Binatia bacterium]|jgi:elongation factor 1-gamma|nr:glutathione S-transferase family protein [Candidatus Binatia bacterium]
MSELRIFSYLPNPRVWKATIAARLCGIDVEVRGVSPKELASWLWDFDARPLSSTELAESSDVQVGKVGLSGTRLHKTRAFLDAHPFGAVPAAFSPEGKTGIFESNSIMRAVARLGESAFPLYGRDAYEASRIDSFLDASLVFAREAQIYLLSLGSGTVSTETHARARDGFAVYAAGINQALSPDRQFLVGNTITIADICFVAELSLFFNERTRARELEKKGLEPILHARVETEFSRAFAHFARLCKHPAFAPDVEPYLKKIEAAAQAKAE